MPDDTNATSPEHLPSGGIPFGMVQVTIYRDPTLSLHAKAVYGLLATYANRDRECWPSRDRIAAELSTSLRTTARALAELQAAGVVHTVHTQTSNRYRLNDLHVGGYVPGSGPLCPSGTVDVPNGPAGCAGEAHETDKRSRPESSTSSTSSDAACGVDSPPSKARSFPTAAPRPTMHIYPAEEFWTIGWKHVPQRVCGYADAAAKAVGLTLREEWKSYIGATVKNNGLQFERQKIIAEVEQWLNEKAPDDAFVPTRARAS